MASLEGITRTTSRLGCARRFDLLAPRGTIIYSSGLGPAEGPGAWLLFDLLRAVATSSSGGTSMVVDRWARRAEASRIVQWVPQLLR